MAKKFAIIGAAGYIAPKHMQAIKDVGGNLVAALDPHDSVGILDRYFPHTLYFQEPERFQRYLEKAGVDYVSICTPNYLHCHYMEMALRAGANAICEKPLVINPSNLLPLKKLEESTGKRIYPILQLRQLPVIRNFKRNFPDQSALRAVEIDYHTYRGPWYSYSWKGNSEQSGGLAYNIGIHLFDIMIHLFGEAKDMYIPIRGKKEIQGRIDCQSAVVLFGLSLKAGDIRRTITVDGTALDMNFEGLDLHTKCYQEILEGRGLSIENTEASLQLAHRIENGE